MLVGELDLFYSSERTLFIFSNFVLMGLAAVVVGEIVDLIASLNEEASKFNKSMMDLNALMRESNFPQALKFKTREFFRYRHDYAQNDGMHSAVRRCKLTSG